MSMKKPGTLIFYIGNSVVKVAVLQKEKSTKPHIVAFERRDLPYADVRDRDQLESRIITEFDALCQDVKRNILTKPECLNLHIKNARIFFSSPWYLSQTKNIHIEHDEPFTVTESLVKQAMADASKPYLTTAGKDFAIIEQNLIKTDLNGYTTHNPYKKTAKTLDLSVFLSFARVSSIDRVRDTVEKHFHLHTVSIHSQSMATFSVIQRVWADMPSYIMMDITSELTELMIVRKNALSEAASFPLGRQFVVRALGELLSTSGDVAASFISLYKDKKLEPVIATKVENALKEIKKQWLEVFTKVLTDMSTGSSLPSKFFLFAPKEVTWLFEDFIKSEEYQQFSFSEGKFEVYDVKVTDLSEYCTWSENADKDLSTAIGSVYDFNMNV